MVLLTKQKIKIILSLFLVISASIIIYSQMIKPEIMVSKISTNDKEAKIQIKSNLPTNYDVKLFKKTKDEVNFKEVGTKEKGIYKNKKSFEINTQDKEKPNNITNIQTSIVDNYVIISFEPAVDNGTEYEYYLEGNNKGSAIQTEVVKMNSVSGIKGYNYIINNIPNSEAGFEVNKLDREPILYSNIDWSKNYYLHIRTIDNNGNYSENLNYKINLPSKGIKMQYVDLNMHTEISPEETIIGNANEEYNLTKYNKKLQGYQLVKKEGEEVGTLKKERINIKYMYAKDASIKIRYLDKVTGKEILKPSYIYGYEGKEYKIVPKSIEKYKYSHGNLEGKMNQGNNEIELYYNELSNIDISYINYLTKEHIIPDKKVSGVVGNTYSIKPKELPEYELFKVEGKEEGEFVSQNLKVTYYYKRKGKLVIKHVDVDTNKTLETDILEGYEGDKITFNSKKIEGYVLKDDNLENKTIEKNSREKVKKTNINNELKEKTKENIIDELLREGNLEEIDEKEINQTIEKQSFQQYDIVMNCGTAEYIIYYKKQ